MATTYVQSKSTVVAAVTSTTMAVTTAILAGDTLVGYFGQDAAGGQVTVSDNINGSWTRTSSGGQAFGPGDVCFFYVANSLAASTGITVTVTAPASATIRAAYANYRGVPGPVVFQTAVAANGTSAAANSGATDSITAGNLVVGGLVGTGSSGSATAGTGYTVRSTSFGERATVEDNLASTAGTQTATFTLSVLEVWYCGVATFGQSLSFVVNPFRQRVPLGRAAFR